MYEIEQCPPSVVLVGLDTNEYDAEHSLDELEQLADTAGAVVQARFLQRRQSGMAATCVGRGRLEEIAEYCRQNKADWLLFDVELTAVQIRNIERIVDVRVIDRTMLILKIFGMHAQSLEGRLQVELAQLKYQLPRLTGAGTDLSRLGGGIGARGPGETQLEADRRYIRRRIGTLNKQLKKWKQRRERVRSRRQKDCFLSVVVVGYTNAGKSTLLNALACADALVEDKLFATLDPIARAIEFPDGRHALLIDTVGFISRLPHDLVEAFRSTLEEAAAADLILHVMDASDPYVQENREVAETLLAELGCADKPTLKVYNKCDRLGYKAPALPEDSVFVSAKTGFGLEQLKQTMAQALPSGAQRLHLLLPYDQARLESRILENGKVFAREYRDDGLYLDALVDRKQLHLVWRYLDRNGELE